MKKEIFDPNMGRDEWPSEQHQVVPPHSLKLGQFALLLKKDSTVTDVVISDAFLGGQTWPANESDAWCPAAQLLFGLIRDQSILVQTRFADGIIWDCKAPC
jgi:hypothetical protein